MSSTYKTSNFNLSKWVSSDVPEMADFNNDNELVDSLLKVHFDNTEKHVSNTERSKWNEQMHVQVYTGTGSSTQSITLTCGFSPRVCLVFSSSFMPGISDFDNKAHYNYFGIATTSGSVPGLTLTGKTLKATQSATALSNTEYRHFNQKGEAYVIIAWR